MTDGMLIEWAGEKLCLLPDFAIFWEREKSLIIADPHFGKPSAFRSAGVPVPTGTTAADLQRLTNLLTTTAARRLVVLGDFFHHRSGQCDWTMELLSAWRDSHSDLDILIVMGNHDDHSHPPPPSWKVDFVPNPVVNKPFLFCHEPCQQAGLSVMSGHIHPAIKLYDPIGHSLRIPCFWFGDGVALLPAFGGFTGTSIIKRQTGDRVYGIVDGAILPIPGQMRR